MNPEIHIHAHVEELMDRCAEWITELARACVRERGVFVWALSGGGTPKDLYLRLALPPHRDAIPWSRTHLFWGDERMVPHDHPASNYGMAYRTLISRVPVPEENVHAIPTDRLSAEQAARDYERGLFDFFALGRNAPIPGSAPVRSGARALFDLILLGLGRDGHTASLFPGSPALDEQVRWVIAEPDPGQAPNIPRVTLTFAAMRHARCAAFLVTGKDKADVLRAAIEEPTQGQNDIPASRVRPLERVVWFVDRPAFSKVRSAAPPPDTIPIG